RSMRRRQQRLQRLHRRGYRDPYESADILVARHAALSDFPPGTFTELDLDENGRLAEVDRAPGENTAGVVVGLVENVTAKHPEGIDRKSTRLNSSHVKISYAVFCLKKKK